MDQAAGQDVDQAVGKDVDQTVTILATQLYLA